jgi:trk system potassium uptake protein TrkH
MIVPVPIAVAFGESSLIPYFLIPAVPTIILGVFLRKRFPPTELSSGKAMALVSLAWIIFPFLSSIPFVFGSGMSFVDGYFESMAGVTATGLTMVENPATLASTMVFWRSFTQWVGGIGIVVLFLSAIIGSGKAARKMYVAEARTERLEPSIRETTRSLWKIYVFFTIIGAIGFFFAGMAPFEAVNHSMTGIATGGFSPNGNSFSGYGGGVLFVCVILMILGATSFAVHRKVLGGDWRKFFGNIEVKLMFCLIAIAALILFFEIGFKDAIFQSTSALTGTGFSTTSLSGCSGVSKGTLSFLMIVGGGYGSTSSALKLIRTIIVIQVIYWIVKRAFLPERAVVPIKVGGQIYTEKEAMETVTYVLIYFLVLVGGMLVLIFSGYGGADSLFEAASAQGNVGLSVGITGPGMPLAGKISLIIQMLVGRLEILPVIALLSYGVSKIPRPSGPRGIF